VRLTGMTLMLAACSSSAMVPPADLGAAPAHPL
jgi:hypothetical protein